MRRRAVLLLFLTVLTGCNWEPPLQYPCMEIPCSWRFASDEGTTLANARWWESLGDPILDTLILTALQITLRPQSRL